MDDRPTHPRLEALRTLWQSKRQGDRLPSRSDFATEELQPWFGHLNIVEVLDGGTDFLYRLHGTDLVEILGMDLTGRRVSDLPPRMQEITGGEHLRVMAAREPVYFRRMRFNRDDDHHTVIKLSLPLAADGETIDMLMLGLYLDD